MSQLTIYLPADVEKRAKREARRLKKSLSAYIASLVAPPSKPSTDRFAKIIGSAPDLEELTDDDLLRLDEPA